MKHETSITYLLIALFFLSQIFGLFLIQHDAQQVVYNQEAGTLEVNYEQTAIGPRPEVRGAGSLLYILLGVGIGTIILLLLIRVRLGKKIWVVWYLIAIIIALTVTFGAFFDPLIALIFAIILGLLKIYYRNFFVHNVTEILMYAGISLLFAPLFDVLWMIVLLVIISLYDMYAVWRSKHMVQLANFTSSSQLFAGLLVNYKKQKGKVALLSKVKKTNTTTAQHKNTMVGVRQAVLGGGDIVFPLLFAGVVFNYLLITGMSKAAAFSYTLFIPVFTTLALYLLLYRSKKGKFYPAMPFLSLGCFVGFGLMQLLILLM